MIAKTVGILEDVYKRQRYGWSEEEMGAGTCLYNIILVEVKKKKKEVDDLCNFVQNNKYINVIFNYSVK